MKFHFDMKKIGIEFFLNKTVKGFGFGFVLMQRLLKIGLGFWVFGVELFTRGNCLECCWWGDDYDSGKTVCNHPDSPYYRESTRETCSCCKWGL